MRQRAVFIVLNGTFCFSQSIHACMCVCDEWAGAPTLEFYWVFITELQGGMLMTKPNYRGLIAATFTKLITAKRRYALQVIHHVGY